MPRIQKSEHNKQTNSYKIGNAAYQFIQIKPERFFGTEVVWFNEARITITDLERTLIDGLTMPQYCGDFAEVIHAFQLSKNKLNLKRIIEYALSLDTVTAKRLGWILDNQGVDLAKLTPLLEIKVKGYRTLDASGLRKGKCNSRWMIQENLPGRINA
ncbi:MAG: hypothetical protein COB50_05340 [Thiotrichales bacterium]|nr:MAG: hypothetical protein COB50_05340 [Thiotrichales bacterium]